MNVILGNVAAKEGFYEEISADDPDLVAKAEALGVRLEDEEGNTKNSERLAAECSGVVQFRPLEVGKTITRIGHPNDDLMEFIQNITKPVVGVWDNHSFAPPAWVESDTEAVALILAQQYGCPIGRPDDWDEPATAVAPAAEGTPASENEEGE